MGKNLGVGVGHDKRGRGWVLRGLGAMQQKKSSHTQTISSRVLIILCLVRYVDEYVQIYRSTATA